jgi:energy-coupling factor transporter ATP-binding protein EcfA2
MYLLLNYTSPVLVFHFILMAGSPGSGKTLLARAMPGILPEMSIEESLDVTRIYSVADQLPARTLLIRHRPFRASHHTINHPVSRQSTSADLGECDEIQSVHLPHFQRVSVVRS